MFSSRIQSRHSPRKSSVLAQLVVCSLTLFSSLSFAEQPKSRTINVSINPRWESDNKLSFQRERPDGGYENVIIDAQTGIQETISNQANDAAAANRLQAGPAPRSTQSAEETFIEFVNQTNKSVQLFWVNLNGKRVPYHKLQPGDNYRQHTFIGHVWEVKDGAGNFYGSVTANQSKTPIAIEHEFDVSSETTAPSDKKETLIVADDAIHSWQVRIHKNRLQRRTTDADNTNWTDIELTESKSEVATLQRPELSPDGTVIAVWQTTPGEDKSVFTLESSAKKGFRSELHSNVYPLPGDRMDHHQLLLVETATGKQIEFGVPVMDFGSPRLRWYHEHQILLEKVDRGHQRFRLLVIDPVERSIATPIDEISQTFIWTNHGPQLPLVTYLKQSDEVLYASERSGWRHLYRVNLNAKKESVTSITHGEYIVRDIEHIDEANSFLDLVVSDFDVEQDPYHQHLIRVNFDGSNLIRLTSGDGDHKAEFSPSREYFVDTYSRVDAPPIHQLRRCRDGELISTLAKAERIESDELLPPMPTVFQAPGRDGSTAIWGYICFPDNYDPASSKQYPVIEQIYAGPHDSHVPKRYSTSAWHQDLSSLGFIVVRIDGMGTANRSKAFHDVCWHNLKDAGFPDRIAWMKAAAEEYPAMDLQRVGVLGTSAGGQNACGAVIFHSDFYKAAVAACGCHDNRMDKASWNEQWMGYPVGKQYAQSSNIEHAAQLGGDLMLILGELDQNVPPASTLRLVDALIKADKRFDFIMIPGMGHGDGGQYGRARTREFFVERLKPKL